MNIPRTYTTNTSLQSIIFAISLLITTCSALTAQPISTTELYKAPFTSIAPVIDGSGSDNCWNDASWISINNLYVGAAYTPKDFTGRYKMVWTASKLFLLVEVTDDILSDVHTDPLQNFWDDDCVEIFLDEDKSGGPHQYNYNAFAYHVSLTYDVLDDTPARMFNNDIMTRRITKGNFSTWEFAINVYADNYIYGSKNTPVTLTQGKLMGFNIAYCDNDGGTTRESFIGSRFEKPGDENMGYINADVFAALELVPATVTSTLPAEDISLKIYPNPSSRIISIDSDRNIDRIVIINSLGKEVFNKTYAHRPSELTVDLTSFTTGTYLLQVTSEKTVSEKKIIVE